MSSADQQDVLPSPQTVAAAPESVGPRIFKNFIVLVGGQGISLGLSGVATILLARYLGTTRLGEFGAIYAYLGLYGWLATFGLDPILSRHAAQNRQQAGSILMTGVVISSLFAIAATALALVIAPAFGYARPVRILLVLAAIDILLLSPLRLPAAIFQVDLQEWYRVGIRLVRQVSWLGVLVLAAVTSAHLTWIIAGRSFGAVLEVALILLAVRRKGFLARPWKLLVTEIRGFITNGLPIAVGTLAVGIYLRIDQVMLHKMVNDEVLGIYVAAVRLTELVNLFPIAVMASLFPVLAQSVGHEDRFRNLLQIGFRSLMVIAVAACILVSLFSTPVVHMLYGPRFAYAAPLLAVLIWSEVPVFYGTVISNALVAKNLQNYLPLSTGVGAIVNVGLNLYLIPRWGAMGAAWATNISYALASIMIFFAFSKTRQLALLGFRILASQCALALAVTQILSVLSLPEILRSPAALSLFGLGEWLVGGVKGADVKQVFQLIARTLEYSKGEAV